MYRVPNGSFSCHLSLSLKTNTKVLQFHRLDRIVSGDSLQADVINLYLPPANEVWGKVIFSEACVKNSVHRGMVCLSAWWDTPPGTRPGTPQPRQAPPTPRDQAPPQDQVPPGPGTPRDQAPSPWDQAPPGTEHAGRYGLRAGGMHPTGM